ncbi:uncharacterized protein [Epargyreus clarus]|uniref:uncharacterized protein n=1 Tax=Epargyreus clarus TaxID=520877 RepID=UPI003C2FEDD6
MKPHVDAVIASARAASFSLRPVLSSSLPLGVKTCIYKQYIRPRLTYAAPAWYALASEPQRKRLRVIQSRALRQVAAAPWYVRNTVIQRDLRVESLDDFIGRLATKMFERVDAARFPHLRDLAPLHARPPDRRAFPRDLLARDPPADSPQLQGAASSLELSDIRTAQVRLPRIELPTYSGKYEEWPTFQDLFVSLVHNNTSLSDVQKLHYLKCSVAGEAEVRKANRSLCNELRNRTSLRGTKEITLEVKVLCTLSFLATGSYQRIVGLTQHMIQRTASRCIHQVVEALNHPAIQAKWIIFPQLQQERVRLKLQFQSKFRLPGVIGCVDCTHIAICRLTEDEHLFYNRKGYHSLNVQMVCDSNLKIINVNPKFGGATHDSFIWASSKVEPYLRGLHQNGEHVWLLGDSGYPLRPWLLTPILDAAPGSRDEIYTQRHLKARNCIERCFGLLKSRWRCLLKHRTLHYHPVKAGKIVLACSVLHNMAIDASLPPPPHSPEEEELPFRDTQENISTEGSQNELIQGRAIRNSLILRLQ